MGMLISWSSSSDSKTSGVGTELKHILEKIGFSRQQCQSCITLREQLNAWGPIVCQDKISQIVDALLERSIELTESLFPIILLEAIKHYPDLCIRSLGSRRRFTEGVVKLAIERAKVNTASTSPVHS